MSKQTNKTLPSDKLSSLALSSSAAAAILLPQAITKAVPQLFTRVAPYTAQALPYCTGVCGSCGASCVGSVAVIAFLSLLAKSRHQQIKSARL